MEEIDEKHEYSEEFIKMQYLLKKTSAQKILLREKKVKNHQKWMSFSSSKKLKS